MEITLKNGNVVIYNNDKDIVLKSNALLKPAQASLDARLTSLRNANTTTDASGSIRTTCDLTFESKSALASFLQGASTNGNRYFEKYLGKSTSTTTTTTTTSTTSSATPNSNSGNTTAADQNKLIDRIINFCKDFAFKPDKRCLNNMLYVNDISEYVVNFMELVNYEDELLEKAKANFKSVEWKSIISDIKSLTPTRDRTNQRLVIKYGEAGCGKSWDAEEEVQKLGQPLIKVAGSASADPDDLYTRFDPTTKSYVLTEIGYCMKNGLTLILDEANLCNSVYLQRLQSALDNSKSIVDRGITIEIKDGFKVIITMNLETNLGKTPLPSPLVSRAVVIENYNNRKKPLFNIW